MCQNLNINMKTTAAFAPWSNGMVERHNAFLAEMIEKIKEDTGCSSEIAICWATNAKNSMSNVHGFSPQQLVLGYNTYCPGLDDEHISLSQIENVTPSKIIADNLNAMYEARSAFLRAHNSERLKRALKGRVYKAYETKYFIGDSVYYKTGDKHWKGPGTVIGQHKLRRLWDPLRWGRRETAQAVTKTTMLVALGFYSRPRSRQEKKRRSTTHKDSQCILLPFSVKGGAGTDPHLLLMRCGDIESNPGPKTQVRVEMNNVKSLQITWEDGRISWIKPYRVKISVAGWRVRIPATFLVSFAGAHVFP